MSNRAKPTKKHSEFSEENILCKVNNPETRSSQRNIDRGINKRGVDSHSSRRSQPGPTEQPQALRERYGDPTNIEHALEEEEEQPQAAMGSYQQPRDQPNPSGLPRQSSPPQQNSTPSNYGPPPRVTGPPSNSSILPERTSPMPSQQQIPPNNLNMDYSLQNNRNNIIQVPPQELSAEEIVQGIKDLKEQIRQAKLQEEFRKLQEELNELRSPNPSTRTNRDISTQGRQNTYMDPQIQVPHQVSHTSKAQDLPRSQVTSRSLPNYRGPSVEQGGSGVKGNFEPCVRSPSYDCQPQPEDSRFDVTVDIGGSTPRTTTSQLYKLMQKKGDLVSQIGYLKRDTEQLKIKLKHFEKIANDYDIRSDQDLYRLLETLVTWKERESYYHRYKPEDRNYDTLKEFLMSGQARVSNVLLARTDRHSMSSRELGDEINHWLAEFRNEGVLTKFLTIHLAPPRLKNRLREKLHLKDKDFQIAWKVMLDTNEQEAKGRARNISYSNAPRSNQNRPTQAQQQWTANNNNEIICRNHQRFGANTYTCLDRRCSMRHQTISPHQAKNEFPNSPQ